MKNILKGGLGGASVLALFYLASVHVSSCGNKGSNERVIIGPGKSATLPISLPNDTAFGGNGSGLIPKVIVICGAKGCYGTTVPDSTPVPPGTVMMEMVFKVTDSIPAHSTVRLQVCLDSATAAKYSYAK